MTTIHYENGEDCLKKIAPLKDHIDLLLVSYLTSFKPDTIEQTSRYDRIYNNGPYGYYDLILSPQDLILFNKFDPNKRFKRYCPGIRIDNRLDDQIRTSTPKEAIKNGADYLIIGRPLWENPIECFL